MSKRLPASDPSQLLKYRDSIYAVDLLICAVAHFDFFTLLKDTPREPNEICTTLQIAPRPADVMLTLFLAMGLIKKQDRGYVLSTLAQDYLVSDTPWSLVPYYASQKDRPQCQEFCEVLKTGQPAGWSSREDGQGWLEKMKEPAFADAFTTAMDSRGTFLAHELAGKLDCSGYQSLLDIAGGSGIYACVLAEAYRPLKVSVLEATPVDRAARRSIAAKQMSARVEVIGGDMFGELPLGYDIHLFANVFHDWDQASVGRLVETSFRAINAGGMIAVFDAHLDETKDGPLAVAEYSCLLMHSTVGRCYSTAEIAEILLDTGFVDVQVRNVVAARSVITARKT